MTPGPTAQPLQIPDAGAARRIMDASAASDRPIAFSDSMFNVLGGGIDPALFDCNLAEPKAAIPFPDDARQRNTA